MLNFFEECLNHASLWDAAQLLAAAIDDTHTSTAGEADICVLGFAGPVDHAAHHRDGYVQAARIALGKRLQPIIDLLGDADDVNLAAPA